MSKMDVHVHVVETPHFVHYCAQKGPKMGENAAKKVSPTERGVTIRPCIQMAWFRALFVHLYMYCTYWTFSHRKEVLFQGDMTLLLITLLRTKPPQNVPSSCICGPRQAQEVRRLGCWWPPNAWARARPRHISNGACVGASGDGHATHRADVSMPNELTPNATIFQAYGWPWRGPSVTPAMYRGGMA